MCVNLFLSHTTFTRQVCKQQHVKNYLFTPQKKFTNQKTFPRQVFSTLSMALSPSTLTHFSHTLYVFRFCNRFLISLILRSRDCLACRRAPTGSPSPPPNLSPPSCPSLPRPPLPPSSLRESGEEKFIFGDCAAWEYVFVCVCVCVWSSSAPLSPLPPPADAPSPPAERNERSSVRSRRSVQKSIDSTHCNTRQHTVTHWNTLEHTGTHCNAL